MNEDINWSILGLKVLKEILSQLIKGNDNIQIGNPQNFIKAIDTILNLIEKQQKEIEELKDFNVKLQATKDRLDSYDKENTLEIEKLKKEIEKLKSKKYILNAETNEIKEIPISDDYISKDKIRKEIEEIKNCRLSTCDEQINKSLNERYEIEDEICEYFEELLGE